MANKIHKRYDGPPDVIYVALEHNSFCGRVMRSDILTSKDEEVTCLLCISNIFKYPTLLERKKERDKEAMLMTI